MDSFETIAQFNQILSELNPTVHALRRAAHFAIKFADSEDYLLPSILNTFNDANVELNTKSTMFQLIDVLVSESCTFSRQPKSNYSFPYVQSIKHQLPNILLQVLPGSHNYNLYNVFVCLKNISKTLQFDYETYEHKYNSAESDLLSADDLENVDADIAFPNVTADDLEDKNIDPLVVTWTLLLEKRKQSYYERLRLLKHQKPLQDEVNEDQLFSLKPAKPTQPADQQLLSKKQILLRMEDDRETHKRSKENLWVVERPKDSSLSEEEFLNYYWNKIDVLNDDENKAFMNTLGDLNKIVAGSFKDKQF